MSQMVAPAVLDYLTQHHAPIDPVLDAIREEGLAAGLPLVDAMTARLLRLLAAATGARRVLEIGTAIGYSAACMAQVMPDDSTLFTMEIDPARAETARRNLARAGVGHRVHVIVGDAERFLHKVAGPFDLVFQDGAKQQYELLLDPIVERMRPGGVLVSDNVLWHGEAVPGFVAEPRRPVADTEAIRRYNRRIAEHPALFTTLLPVGDGVALSLKRA